MYLVLPYCTHGYLQLEHQKLRVGGCTKEALKWFNYPLASAHSGCEVSCRGCGIDLHRGLSEVEKAVLC